MNIIGKSQCTPHQMAEYLISKNPGAKPWALEYAKLYLEEGEAEGVRGDGAWIQSCIETGNFKFNGGTAVTFSQNNFCGLGVTEKGMKGQAFQTPRLGIRAQIQHLKGYATPAPLNQACVDPRYRYINPKGKAPAFEDLAGKWAVPGYDTSKASSLEDAMKKGIGYGFDILSGVRKMKSIPLSGNAHLPSLEEADKPMYKIAIDAGHGSNTAGKRTPDGYREHWINVKCADYFHKALKRCGFEAIKTGWNDTDSTDDTDVALSARQKLIKNAQCDISVSWHANAFGDGRTYNDSQGIETLIHNNPSYVKDSGALAVKVQNRLVKGTRQKNRGVKAQSLAMCNCTAMGTNASILIEIGFMTNEYEAKLMQTDAFCMECAEEAAQGVCEYLGTPYRKPLNPNPAPSPAPSAPQPSPQTAYPHTEFVMDIQKALGAKADGIAGNETLSRTITVSRTQNRNHAVVRPIQKYLNSVGYSCGTVDGIAGARFDAAVKAFQKANGCVSDGEITARNHTWKKLLKLS